MKNQRWLPVRLNTVELLDRSRTMSERCREKRELESKKAAEMRRFSDELKDLNGEIARLSEIVASGEEDRPVDCREEIQGGDLVIIRLDTGAEVSRRRATDEEKQRVLFPE